MEKIKSMTIVLCSKGYPGKFKKLVKIKNLTNIKLKKNLFIFHAGTKYINGNIFSNGGRVLNVTSVGKTFKKLEQILLRL